MFVPFIIVANGHFCVCLKINFLHPQHPLLRTAKRQNALVERAELQKVWEDEGVIVGRRLDVFISKLRKKLEHDPSVRLVNVHGKGYKIEVNEG